MPKVAFDPKLLKSPADQRKSKKELRAKVWKLPQPPEARSEIQVVIVPPSAARIVTRKIKREPPLQTPTLTSKTPLAQNEGEKIESKEPSRPRVAPPSGKDIVEICCKEFSVHLDDFLGKSRVENTVHSRWTAWVLIKCVYPERSLPTIAKTIGKFDHTNVAHGFQRLPEVMHKDENLREKVEGLADRLGVRAHFTMLINTYTKKSVDVAEFLDL